MKRRGLRWGLAVAMLLAIAGGVWLAGRSVAPTPIPGRTVRVALDPQWSGQEGSGWRPSDSPLAGYLQAISQKTGLRFRYELTGSRQASLQQLQQGQADLVPVLLGIDEPIDVRYLRYSVPYYQGNTVIISRQHGADYASLDDLTGKTLAFKAGGEYEQWLRQHRPQVHRLPLPSLQAVLAAVESGAAEAAIGVDVVYQPWIRRDYQRSLHVTGTAVELPVAIRVLARRQDAALVSQLNTAIRTLSPSQRLQAVMHWQQVTLDPAPTLRVMLRHYRVEVAFGALALLALLFALYQLRRRQLQARAGAREKARLLAVMSHEVRNAANALVSAVELLAAGPALPAQLDLLDAARASGTSLRLLLDNALEYSRLEAGRFAPQPVACDVHALARNCLAAFAPQAEEKGVELLLSLPGGTLPWLWLDPVCLHQILINLVSNAIKFTAQGQVIVSLDVQYEAGQAQLLLQVQDSGAGMSVSVQRRLFEPFIQAEDARALGGAGLGLSICSNIIHQLGGQIAVTSELGQGSTFRVQLPVARQEGGESQAAAVEASPPSLSLAPDNAKVLLVEDHPYSRRMLTYQLEQRGYQVHAVVDGQSAEQALYSQGPFQAGILDCNLPDGDGYTLARRLRGIEAACQWPPMRLVAVSALTGEGHEQACRAAGMDAVVSKPISLPQLLQHFPATQGGPLAIPDSLQSLFETAFIQDREALCEAMRAQDWERARHHAHRIQGSALIAGRQDLASMAEHLEDWLQEPDSTDWSWVTLLAQLQAAEVG